jgi:[protein-PII] uridylyltransferase
LAARQRLAEGRAQIREQHRAGSPGIQVCARLTELVDTIVLELFDSAVVDLDGSGSDTLLDHVALVAHGGYGRRDLAPYSDIDLMILHQDETDAEVAPLAKRLLSDLFDAGLEPGHSVRSISQACEVALTDATIATSLVESRLLAGSPRIYQHFQQRFQRTVRGHAATLLEAIDRSRRDERSQYGDTVFLLEPNIKRSEGGLREIQLLRWVGYVRYGSSDPDELNLAGVLSKRDQRVIQRTREFLLKLRNELHFFNNKHDDVLSRAEQLRIAELYKYPEGDAILPVERFMQEYFQHTKAVRSIVSDFLESARPVTAWSQFLGRLVSYRVDGDYRVGPRHISATPAGLARLRTDMREVLNLLSLANLHNKRIDQKTWETVRSTAHELPGDVNLETAQRFLALLSQPTRLGELLHRVHELGVLEKIIPQFVHARCLLQFNQYHKYTVDEHCIRAVRHATEFIGDNDLLGRVYRGIKQKRTLHLALLIHDLGKGFVEDHSEVGLRIADEVSRRLRLPLREAEMVKFLVHKHLIMGHLAFRRDTSDDQLVVRFAVDVGSPEALDMLFVLTAADFSAVGPGVWNDWKADVLADLYRRTRRHLAADAPLADQAEQLHRRRTELSNRLKNDPDQAWYERQINALPAAYLTSSSTEKIASELKSLHDLGPGEVRAESAWLTNRRAMEFVITTQAATESHEINSQGQALEFVVSTHEEITPGVFHRLTGALTSQGLEILSATINTLAGGLVLDRFYVLDPDFAGEPSPERIASVKQALIESLRAPNGGRPTFRKIWQIDASHPPAAAPKPPRVLADNSSSDVFTILDITATDRTGLLYTIARTLFELGLSVSRAKIGTYLDQVVDVFYVTDQEGRKIQDDDRLQEITSKLLEAIRSENEA